MNRTGKIARLPHHLREDLNRRLEGNLRGREIVEWLNSLPEVQKVLQALFRGKAVSEQNLSEWRHGGFAEWQTRREFLEDVRESAHHAADLEEAAALMADHAAGLLAIRYSDAISQWNGDPDDPAFASLNHLSPLIRDVAILSRRAERATRLKMDKHAFDAACQSRRGTLKREDTRFASSPYAQKWSRRFGPADPHFDPKQDPQRILDGLERLTQEWLSSKSQASPPPCLAGPSVAPPVNSNVIKPPQTTNEDLDGEKTPQDPQPLPHSDSTAAPPQTTIPTGIVTRKNVTTSPAKAAAPDPLPESDWHIQLPIKTIPPRQLPGYEAPEPLPTPRKAILARAGS